MSTANSLFSCLLWLLLPFSFFLFPIDAPAFPEEGSPNSFQWFVNDVSHGEDRGEVVAVDHRGRIVVAGTADARGGADFFVVRYFPDGRSDDSFGDKGVFRIDLGGTDFVHALGIDKDDRIIVGGFRAKKGTSDFALIRLLGDGAPDPSFGSNGRVIHDESQEDEIHYLAIQRDGKVVVAGFTGKRRSTDFALLRFDTAGQLDPGFGKNGLVRIDETSADRLYGLSLQMDGKAVAVGSVKEGGNDDCALLRIGISGERDESFGSGGLVKIPFSRGQDVCSAVGLDRQGFIVAVGFAETRGRDTDFAIARLHPRGELDRNFGKNGIVLSDFGGGIDVAHAVAIDERNRIYVGGEYQKNPATLPYRNGFALVIFDDPPLFVVDDDPLKNSCATGMTLLSDRSVLLGGERDGALAVARIREPHILPPKKILNNAPKGGF